jgi:hypothetical protein
MFPAITRTTKAVQGLPDAKISLWPFLAQKMPKAVEKEKKSPKPIWQQLLMTQLL